MIDATADPMDDIQVGHSHPIPYTRPAKPVPIDVAAIRAYTLGVLKAREAYSAQNEVCA